jgi:iron complex outermembrane receptor protein
MWAGLPRWGVKALLGCALGMGLCVCTGAQTSQRAPDLADLSLEQLASTTISVSSFARKEEDLWLTPAAVYVIGREEIERSAASSIPELLRGVPGLQVAQINASYWAVTARGFNSEYASKLLVLIDGRTVYSEIYSGTHWDAIDLPLQEIERIEVIRGAGAAVWGTNAVNGVVNIITTRTREKREFVNSARASRIDETVNVEADGTLAGGVTGRAYVRYKDRQALELASGARAFDGAGTWRSGGRVDWRKSKRNSLLNSGDVYGGHLRTQLNPSVDLPAGPNNTEFDGLSGGYALSRWEHTGERQDCALQVYFDVQSRRELAGSTRTRTLDLDYQSHRSAGRHDLVWGGEFRFTADHIGGNPLITAHPNYRNELGDGFVQDEIALLPRKLTMILGTKLQVGTLAGFQVQPSARLLFAPDKRQTMWLAISRAGVSPSIQDEDTTFPLTLGTAEGLPVLGELLGTPNYKAETVVGYEAGYRRRMGETLSVDLAGFFTENHRVQSITFEGAGFQPVPSPHVQAEFLLTSGFRALSGGVEAAVVWKPVQALSVHANYAWMQARTTQVDPGSVSIVNAFNAPHNAVAMDASWSFARSWSADAKVSRVGGTPTNPLPSLDPTHPNPVLAIPAYTRLDMHVSRKLGRSVLLDAGGTNLLSARHVEFDPSTGYIAAAYVPRSWFVKGSWSF